MEIRCPLRLSQLLCFAVGFLTCAAVNQPSTAADTTQLDKIEKYCQDTWFYVDRLYRSDDNAMHFDKIRTNSGWGHSIGH
jgi:hypothetical protein